MLHLAWVWLPVGLTLIAVALLRPDWLALPAALHALTVGAMGSMILAIAARAAMAREAGRLVAGRGFAIAFALVWLAACLRITAAVIPQGWPDPIKMSAAVWMLGWLIFLWSYRPALRDPLPWPILSANRHRDRAGQDLTSADQSGI